MSSPLKGVLVGLAGFGLFSMADATIKFLGGSYNPVQIMAFAGLFTLPLIGHLWLKAPVSLRPVHPWLMAIRTFALIGNGLLVTYTFTAMPLAEAYAIFFTLPLILTLLAWPVLGDRIDLTGGAAVLIGLVGGAEASVPMLLYPVLGQTAAAFLLLPGRYVPMPADDLATVVLLSLGGFGGTLLMFAAYRAAPPVVVAPTQYSQIAWAALFGALFFAEPMTAGTALGMVIIAAAGLLVVLRQDRARPTAAE
jgi:drug/metabolite transporter (DMT)-like permease